MADVSRNLSALGVPANPPAGADLCPHCGGARTKNQRYCPWCGQEMTLPAKSEAAGPVISPVTPRPLVQAATAPPVNTLPAVPAVIKAEEISAGAMPAQSAPVTCHNCNHPFSPPGKFCSNCGKPAASPSSGLELVIHSADGQDQRLPLGERDLLIGRGTDCDLCLAGDGYLSRRHARLSVQAGRILLEDLGSAHGTWGRLQQVTELESGDQILMGTTVLTITEANLTI